MNPWIGLITYFAAVGVSVAIRAPHDARSRGVRIELDRKGKLEIALLVLMGLGVLVLPVLFAATNVLSFADYPLTPVAFGAGIAFTVLWLWLFHRSHADLGTNWSVSLQVRENHVLVTSGVYRHLRHPMYAAIFAESFAQALLLANWIAGPATLVAFTLMFTCRLRIEEGLMRARFGETWDAYARTTRRLIPRIW